MYTEFESTKLNLWRNYEHLKEAVYVQVSCDSEYRPLACIIDKWYRKVGSTSTVRVPTAFLH